MDKVKFAVVGLGNIGSRHLAVLDAEQQAQLVGICDIELDKCRKYAKLYKGVPFFCSYEQMLKETDAEVINICTPHGLHSSMAIAAAKIKRHVLVEKPMALTIAEAEKMIATAKENGVRLMVVKQNRYNIPIAVTKNALASGKLGRLFMVQCNVLWNRQDEYYLDSSWRGKKELEGGALYTQVSHFIDLMVWWLGDVVEATAEISTKNHAIEIEDCGSALLRFSSGVMGSLTWTTCVYNRNYEGSITIIGEKGIIKIGGQYLNKIEHWDVQAYPLPEDIEFVDKPNSYGKYQGTSSNHDKVINDVVRDLLFERHNVVEGDEGMKTIKAIELIYRDANMI
jgi:UDP-N-acetyl-2-amino-2-deoxyglucuronate dehydrogenase